MIQLPPPYGAQQVIIAQPVQTAMAVTNQTKPGAWGAMKITGIIQVVLGALTIILGIASGTMPEALYFTAIWSPLWCGFFFYVVAGSLGTAAGRTKNQCAAVAYMVMSIFACLSALVVIGWRSTAVAINCSSYRAYGYGGGCSWRGQAAVDSMLLILAVAEFFVAIVGASTTCGAVCCTGMTAGTPTQTVHYYQTLPQVVVAGQPQVGVVTCVGQVPQQQFQVAYQPQPAVPNAPQGQFQPPPQAYQPQPAVPNAPQGQFQPPPQAYQPLAPGLEQASAAPVDPKGEHLYQPLIK